MGGRKIDDHGFWAGGRSKDSVLPKGVHHKHESSEEGFGALGYYEDTTEAIAKQQGMAKKDVHSHPRKDLHRN